MRVIFMGTPDFAVPTLDALADAGHEIVLVVAQPDKPAGRGKQLRPPPVAVRAVERGLPLAQPRALRSGPFPDRYVGLGADVGLVIAYGRILPERLLDAPTHGCVNVHASLLPRWRGAAPIQAAILHGDRVTGVCTQRMEPSLDTGPVYLAEEIELGPHETAGQLHDRLARLSAQVAVRTLDLLGREEPTPQPEAGITWAPKIEKSDGRIDWRGSAVELDRRIRAMTPWPGGFVDWKNGPLKLRVVRVVDGSAPPSTVLSVDPLVIACGEGALELQEVQAPGKRAVAGSAFARGLRLSAGQVLTRPA